LEGHESLALNLTSKPPGLALTLRVSRATKMTSNYSALLFFKRKFWDSNYFGKAYEQFIKTCEIFRQYMVPHVSIPATEKCLECPKISPQNTITSWWAVHNLFYRVALKLMLNSVE